MNAKTKYWVLVANSGQARILELQRIPYEFHQVSELVSEAQHLTNKDMVSDASGRVYHTQGPGTHSMQQRSDPHENAEALFARGLTEKLEKARRLGRFTRLLVIADPKTLGRLRQHISMPLSECLVDEVTLDLVGLPQPQLEQRVRDILGWST